MPESSRGYCPACKEEVHYEIDLEFEGKAFCSVCGRTNEYAEKQEKHLRKRNARKNARRRFVFFAKIFVGIVVAILLGFGLMAAPERILGVAIKSFMGVTGLYLFLGISALIMLLTFKLVRKMRREPKEVKWTLSALDKLERAASNAAFSIVRNDIQAQIRDTKKTINSIKQNQMKPEALAALLTSNAVQSHLLSGQYHTYRGVLSTGKGELLLGLWDFAVDSMANTGQYTDEEADNEKEWIRAEIEKVG